MTKKRKADGALDDDGHNCKCLFDKLVVALAKRITASDEYVQGARQGIERARAEVEEKEESRERALRQRELAVQAREHAVEQKTEELTVLRAEVSSLYHQLQAQLPDLHSRVHGLECLEDRQGSAGAADRAPSGNNEQSWNADDDSNDAAELEVVLPEAHGQPPAVPEPFTAQHNDAPGQQAHLHGSQRLATPQDAAGDHTPACQAHEPASTAPQPPGTRPIAMPFLPPQSGPHAAAAAEASPDSSPKQNSAFARVELLGGSGTGCRGRQGPPSGAAKDQPSSPRRFVPHARPAAPQVHACNPPQQEGPIRAASRPSALPQRSAVSAGLPGVPSRSGAQPQHRALPVGMGRGLPQSANRLGGLHWELTKEGGRQGLRGRGGSRGGGRARSGRGGHAPFSGGVPGFQPDTDGRDLDNTVQQLRALTQPQQAPATPAIAAQPPVNGMSTPDAPGQQPDSSSADAQGAGMMKEAIRAKRKRSAAPSGHASALPALAADAPDLLRLLKRQNFAEQLPLLDPAATNVGDAASPSQSLPTLQDLYSEVHGILGRILSHAPGKAAHDRAPAAADARAGSEYCRKGHECYTLAVLQCLVEAADKYSVNGHAPVRWGWCRELQSFVFVFEAANRIVVEKPEYSHATYFFELEQPLPVHAQVQRLVAVLSVPAVTRGCLLADAAPDLAAGTLSDSDAAALRAAGWTPGGGVRSLLNFTGERSLHRVDDRGAKADATAEQAHYRERLARLLQQGAAGGRLHKPWQAAQPAPAG